MSHGLDRPCLKAGKRTVRYPKARSRGSFAGAFFGVRSCLKSRQKSEIRTPIRTQITLLRRPAIRLMATWKIASGTNCAVLVHRLERSD